MHPEIQPETLCAHARHDVPAETRPLVAPIYQTAVWALESAEQCDGVYAGELPGYIYTRDANPNHAALEAVVAALEGAEEAVVFGSGMGAVSAAVSALSGAGGRLVAARQLYGATSRLLAEEWSRFGVRTTWVDVTDPAEVERALEPGADLVLVETLANPLLQLAPVPQLGALCRQYQAKLVIDNTFTTPCGLRPLQHGADLVVHSLTKFLAGHSDLTLGAVAGPAELIARVRKCARLWGASANPFESWLALRGITTLPLRWQRSCENALELASRLEAHPGILRVWYPGLASHPQHLLASRLLQKPGAMLAFEVEGAGPARELLRSLRHIRFAPSLGDVATTISYPVATSHRGIAETELLAQGITPGVLRLSVGIDHLEDIWDDLAQALNPARPR